MRPMVISPDLYSISHWIRVYITWKKILLHGVAPESRPQCHWKMNSSIHVCTAYIYIYVCIYAYIRGVYAPCTLYKKLVWSWGTLWRGSSVGGKKAMGILYTLKVDRAEQRICDICMHAYIIYIYTLQNTYTYVFEHAYYASTFIEK